MSIRYPQLSSDPVIGDHGHVVGAFSNSGNSVQEHTIWRHEVEPAEISETHPTLSGALERAEYDIPPPGSPPHSPTRSAIGNTNGILGAEPDRPSGPRRSIFNNIFGVLRRNHYEQVSMESTPGPAVGGGTANDGVFANMAARPQKNVAIRTSDGRVHMVPEDAVHELPPVRARLSYFLRLWED